MAKSKPAACPKQQALIICRNKHWRYISAFHGPWLQLPLEILESLAHSNFQAPRPHPIDPAVFYDLVKIRKAVDEATNLAVRATSGLTSAALSSQANAANGILGGAAQLGLGYVAGGQNTKLSRERKYRMRELATQKLSHAYHLDEIAASVATMQSASTLDDVAQFVLQRSADPDAKYVHFFHEKIPSRMMAEYTPLDPLDHIISERPNDGSALRTRALTRLFTEDYIGAARDLTDGLSIARYVQQQHRAGRDQLVLASSAREEADARRAREWRVQPVKEEDQPNSLETQLLFHRAGVYLSLACQYVSDALDGLQDFETKYKVQTDGVDPGAEQPSPSPEEKEAHRKRLENRKLVKTYAKRAVRDYLAFLARFEYTPGINPAVAEGFLHKVNDVANGVKSSEPSYRKRVQELTDSDTEVNGQAPDALVKHQREIELNSHRNGTWSLPPPAIHPVSALFSSTPPADLPPYPPLPLSSNPAMNPFAESQETVTYHPLLTDALHSLLLCHALIQTPPTELRRHAYNVSRIARISDGYPIFLAARSPARADWIEVLHRAKNWVNLGQSWDQLCRPAPLPGSRSSNSNASSSSNGSGSSGGSTTELAQTTGMTTSAAKDNREPERATQQLSQESGHSSEHKRHEAILDALADERVVDEESFQRAVRAHEQRCRRQGHGGEKAENNVTSSSSSLPPPPLPLPRQQATEQPKSWTQDDVKEYSMLTERAEAVARWVREAPRSVGAGEGGGGKKRRGKKGGAAATKNGSSATATTTATAVAVLEAGVRDLGLDAQGGQSGEGGNNG
ncbi:hypothetical protein BFW01_g10898 [Lasiodiplodia theobromae]|uniref:Uncharacterized protein n=1 Tax=Lasiodiplodia theobromae TaxID=45133 RepID=A0A8H7IQL0_9PEZI|nr:hypothetical protein BFW01_g10898 [Lasiodiplodia theobromae]